MIDTRPATEYADGHMPGTINIPFNSSFVTWAGWLVQADEFYLIVDAATAAARLGELARELALIGVDQNLRILRRGRCDWPGDHSADDAIRTGA